MPLEIDDQSLRVYGYNERKIRFFDDDRNPVADIYLGEDGVLNVGSLQVDVSGNGSGGGLDLSAVGFLTVGSTPLLSQERILAAGDGLVATDDGGGNNFTLAVRASDLIGAGLQESGNNIALQTPGTLSQASSNSASGSHTHAITSSSNPGANARILASTAAGALTLQQLNVDNIRLDGNTISAQTGDLTLTAAGDDVLLPSAKRIGADNFVSQLTGWRVDYDGSADFRQIYADELHVKAFIADIEQALAGGQIISKSVTTLSRDFVVPFQGDIVSINTANNWVTVSGDQTAVIDVGQTFTVVGTAANDGTYTVASVSYANPVTRITANESFVSDAGAVGEVRFWRFLYVNDLPGFENTAVFASLDWVRLRVIDRSGGGLVVADVWGQVTGYTDDTGGEQHWNFRCRDDGGVAGEQVNAGAIAIDYGTSGDGYWEVTALDSDGPYSQIVTWTSDPSVPANHTLHMRLGNLDGVTDGDFSGLGGWGLYSDNAFLKGDLYAAGGKVVVDDNGITIVAPESYDAPNAITWEEGGDVVGAIFAKVSSGTPEYLEIWGNDPSTDSGPRITLYTGDTLGGNTAIQMVADSYDFTGATTFEVETGTDVHLVGDVAVGHTSPSYKLDVQGNIADYLMKIFNDGNAATRHGILMDLGEDANPSAEYLRFRDGDGNVVGRIFGNGAGSVTYGTSSDERIKQDIEALDAALDKVLALEPIKYRGRGAPQSRPKRAGFSAQAVRSVIPDVVSEMDGDFLSLDYMGLVPYLVGAVQALNARLEALEAT